MKVFDEEEPKGFYPDELVNSLAKLHHPRRLSLCTLKCPGISDVGYVFCTHLERVKYEDSMQYLDMVQQCHAFLASYPGLVRHYIN